jgi:WD40 repeat protein
VSASQECRKAASIDSDGKVLIWDGERAEATGRIDAHEIQGARVSMSADGSRVLSGGWDFVLPLWETETGKLIGGHPTNMLVHALWLDANGGKAYTNTGKADLTRWDFVVDEPIWTAKGASGDSPNAIDVSRGGSFVLTGSLEGKLVVWDAVNQKAAYRWQAHAGAVQAVAISPDRKLLLSGGSDHVAILWSAENRELRQTLRGHHLALSAVHFLADGRFVLTASHDENIILWETESGKVVARMCLPEAIGSVAVCGDRVVVGDWSGEVLFLRLEW